MNEYTFMFRSTQNHELTIAADSEEEAWERIYGEAENHAVHYGGDYWPSIEAVQLINSTEEVAEEEEDA